MSEENKKNGEELKTLANLKTDIINNNMRFNWDEIDNYNYIIKEELGIKRIKRIREEKKDCHWEENYLTLDTKEHLLMELFNITEEDLKL